MRIMSMPRGCGKTYELISMSARTGEIIVCRSIQESDRILEMAKERELDIPAPLTFSDIATRRHFGKFMPGLLIDEVDEFIMYITQYPVSYCTYTPT